MKKVSFFLLLLIFSIQSHAKDFTWQNLSVLYSKIYPHFDYRVSSNDFIEEFHPKIWKEYKNDEFLLEEKRPNFIAEMKDKVKNYDMDEPYEIHTQVTLDKYDFENNIFPIQSGFSEAHYFKVKSDSYVKSYPRRFKLFFNNANAVKGFEMDAKKAREFVSGRKNNYGKVDRRIKLKLKAKVLGFKGNNKSNEFIGEILSYSFYEK